MKRAIIFYSLTEHTKEAADKLAELTGAETFRIQTVVPMPEEMGKQMMTGGMQAVFGICPKITGLPNNLSEYDEIILGTPIWAGKNASPINTLLKDKQLRGKITAVFTFSGGGDNDRCIAGRKKKLVNLKHTVALADKKNELSKGNDAALEAFAGEIM